MASSLELKLCFTGSCFFSWDWAVKLVTLAVSKIVFVFSHLRKSVSMMKQALA